MHFLAEINPRKNLNLHIANAVITTTTTTTTKPLIPNKLG
jgi:hypothetical protein